MSDFTLLVYGIFADNAVPSRLFLTQSHRGTVYIYILLAFMNIITRLLKTSCITFPRDIAAVLL